MGQSRQPCLLGPCLHIPCHGGARRPRVTRAGLGSLCRKGPGWLRGLRFPWMEPGSKLAAAERRGRMVWGGMRGVLA